MRDSVMMAQIIGGSGFIAALDQSGGSTPIALKNYGIESDAYAGDEEMFALIHEMRSRIVTAARFNGRKILGAILFERTMDAGIGGKPVPTFLRERGVVPFLKIDQGLEDEVDGVRLMKPIAGLKDLLKRAKAKGVFGTKMRSLINNASSSGGAAIVRQQFDTARRVLARGLMPIVEPEISIRSETRAQCEKILRSELIAGLDALPHGHRVMLKLSLPLVPDFFAPLVAHPNCARVLALSGGFSQAEACTELASNHAMIASFSRALLQDLHVDMDDVEFDKVLGEAIDRIHRASTMKTLEV